jgi:hypothetical protein
LDQIHEKKSKTVALHPKLGHQKNSSNYLLRLVSFATNAKAIFSQENDVVAILGKKLADLFKK